MSNAPVDRLSSAQRFLSRLARVAVEEVSRVKPRKIAAEVAAGILPQQTFNRTRTAVLRAAGVHIGKHSLVLGPVRLTGDGDVCAQLTIGSYTIITGPIHADLGAPVVIGDRVRIGHNVSLLTISHEIGEEWLRSGSNTAAPIEIGDGVWLASHVTVLGGVKIGAGSIVAAGAMVTRDVPPNTLVAGIPARVQKNLPTRPA
jgi:maltose O-acetyltransferase